MKVLVVAAHPDDEVLGCGGTIAKMVSDGHTVMSVILGEGVAARYGVGDDTVTERNNLHTSARTAAKILGAEKPKIFAFPDNRFDSVPLLDLVKEIESVIESFKPQMVFTQHGGDLNVDHMQTFRAVLAATRPMQGAVVKSVLSFEVNSSTEWAFQRFSPSFRPSVFVDIGKTLTKKMKALQAYASEMRAFPHPRSEEAVRAQAIKWGSVAGLQAAEAFEVIWEVR
jgi:LmbE family N-acetylglucosaminyl deacetylase